ncbi:MAG: hypothetical protein OXM55_07815 [Bdellovibrionales bacterium]|nr:hypothetical protein [Bdellovibrionales bacterium]
MKKVTEEIIAIKENTLSALKKLTDKIETTTSQIYEMKKEMTDKLQALESKIQERIKAIIKELRDIKEKLAKVNEVLQETRSNQIKISEENSTKLSHLDEELGGTIKASENNQEKISKLNTLIRLATKKDHKIRNKTETYRRGGFFSNYRTKKCIIILCKLRLEILFYISYKLNR